MLEMLNVRRPVDHTLASYTPVKIRRISEKSEISYFEKQLAILPAKVTEEEPEPRKYNKAKPPEAFSEIAERIFDSMIKMNNAQIDYFILKEITDYLNKSEEMVLNYILLKTINKFSGMNFFPYSEYKSGERDGNEIKIKGINVSEKAVKLAVISLQEKGIIFTHNFKDKKELLYILKTPKGEEIYEKAISGKLSRSDCKQLINTVKEGKKLYFDLDLKKDILPDSGEKDTQEEQGKNYPDEGQNLPDSGVKITQDLGKNYPSDGQKLPVSKVKITYDKIPETQSQQVNIIKESQEGYKTGANDHDHDHINQLLKVIDDQIMSEKNIPPIFSDDEKYKILCQKIDLWDMPLPVLKSLIKKHTLDNVFYCTENLEKRESGGYKIENFAGCLTNSVKKFKWEKYFKNRDKNKSANRKQEEKATNESNFDKYFEILTCLDPDLTKFSLNNNWHFHLNVFIDRIFSSFFEDNNHCLTEILPKLKSVPPNDLEELLLQGAESEKVCKVISEFCKFGNK